jgi:hypothetical protein
MVDDKLNRIVLTSVLIILGVILMSTVSFSISRRPIRVDYWIYGRYSEAYLLPILIIGVVASWKKYNLLIVPLLLSVIGLFLSINISEINTKLMDNNIVNSVSFWPNAIRGDVDFTYWFLIGALTILVLSILIKYVGKSALILVIPIYLITIINQNEWHNNILAGYSKNPQMYNFIAENYSQQDCIGFELDEDKQIIGIIENERMKLLSYYLYSYNFNRMSYVDWYNNCEGPYVTTNDDYVKDLDTVYVAREKDSGIFVITKSNQTKEFKYNPSELNDLYINTDDEECVARGCFILDASELQKYTVVGVRDEENNSLKTSEQGIFLFGPYYGLKKGSYKIFLDAEIRGSLGNNIYVKSNKGQKIHYQSNMIENKIYPFTIEDDVDDLEVSIVTDGNSEVIIKGYSIVCSNCK